jgi:uncharacterized protein involved in exopolysaccharide biosynthesis
MEAARTMPLEPTLADVLRDVWRARLPVLAGALAGLLAALIFLRVAVPQYRAEMLVAPASHGSTPDISSLMPDNAGAAMQFVLQSFSSGDSSDFMRFEAILREPTIAARLLQDDNIRRGLAHAGRWNFLAPPPLDSAPRLAAWLQDNLEVEPVGATRLRRIIFKHPDPAFAALLLRRIYDATDDLIRAEREETTAQRIAYLEKTIDQTANPDHKRDLTKLLMDQEQIAMILAVHEPFAASLAEPPAAGAKPDWPHRPLVISSFMLVGVFLGYVLHGLRRRK